jgi:hypothetical protein
MVWQDGLYICRKNCYEQNGGEIDRTLDRARGASIAAALSAREHRPPKQAGWWDDKNIALINGIAPKPLVLIRGGAAATLTLFGVGFSATDAVTYDDANITNTSSITTETTISLSVQAGVGAIPGQHVMSYNGARYLGVIDVR